MGHPEPVSESFVRPPRLNGRYVVSRLIGRGAQARVYLAFDTRLKQWRAVKVLAPSYLDDDHVRARFEQEAQAMARLSHPNLVRVVDVDHDGRTPYMVMELARGGAVTEWMKRHGPVPPILACRITQACCEGLAHAHAQNVVHRDVKPHNVLVREDGSIGLTDFGIAQVQEGEDLTATGTIMGTFAFMAPEQRTDSKGVDLRADVYSLGATLYTMMTGRTSAELFFAESRDAILSGIPEVLRDIILTACKYEREQRYASMVEFRDAIERRISRLPRDPVGTELLSELLSLPDGPPEWADAGSGVDELRRALIAGDEAPTLTRPAAPPSERSFHNEPTPSNSPYRMPASQLPQHRRHAERPDDVPDYVDMATFNAIPVKHVEIDDIGARSLHAAPPDPAGLGRRAIAAIAASSFVGMFVALMLTGLAGKVYTSWQVSNTSDVLVHTANEERQVIADLVSVGADEAALQDRWFRFREAPPEQQPEAAAAFAELVAIEAEQTGVKGLPLSHVSQLGRARRSWTEAIRLQAEVRGSYIARLTGDLGVW